eukprot:gene3164-2146_t
MLLYTPNVNRASKRPTTSVQSAYKCIVYFKITTTRSTSSTVQTIASISGIVSNLKIHKQCPVCHTLSTQLTKSKYARPEIQGKLSICTNPEIHALSRNHILVRNITLPQNHVSTVTYTFSKVTQREQQKNTNPNNPNTTTAKLTNKGNWSTAPPRSQDITTKPYGSNPRTVPIQQAIAANSKKKPKKLHSRHKPKIPHSTQTQKATKFPLTKENPIRMTHKQIYSINNLNQSASIKTTSNYHNASE